MKKAQVFFRVDGSAQIGLGHLVRCIALAQMLKDDFDICFICKTIPENTISEIERLEFKLNIILAEEAFFSTLTFNVIVVIDHYGLDTNYQKRVKDIGCKLVCIDDLHDKVFFADLIINHAPGIEPGNYSAQTYTQYALGLDYALLRPVFLAKALQQQLNDNKMHTVLVCFGGSDVKNITQKVVSILKTDKRFKKIIVVVGAAYGYINDLRQLISDDLRVNLYDSVDEKKIADLMIEANLAIVPASGILQEVLAIGCKVISGMYVENQRFLFENYKALGAFESADDFSEISIRNAIEKCHATTNNPHIGFIDGKAGIRLAKYFKQFLIEDDVFLVNANESHLTRTFDWAANLTIRKFFFNRSPIIFEEHEKWFINKLNSEACFYYLGIIKNHEFGSVRFDLEKNGATISYLIDPLYQKQGLGTILLRKGLELFLKQAGNKVEYVYGEVFFENIASIKIFKKLGYTVINNPSEGMVKYKKMIC